MTIEETGAPYALIGAFAMAAHGYQRATNDIDFLVHGAYREAILASFTKAGFGIFHQSDEVIQLTNVTPVDLLLANRPISQAMLAKSGLPVLDGVPCLLAEDIIGLKIQAYHNDPKRKLRDLADIQSLCEAKPLIRWDEIKWYADLFDCWSEIRAIREVIDA